MNNTLDRFGADCKLRQLASTRDYVCYSRQFAEFLAARGRELPQCSREDLQEYLRYLREDRKVKQATVKRIFTVVRSLYSWMADEGLIQQDPVPAFRKRYLRSYKDGSDSESRKIVSVEDAARLVGSILDSRDRAIIMLLFKTGMRLGELISLDVKDVDLEGGWVRLKPTAKRSNRTLPLDDETIRALQAWMESRKYRNPKRNLALFTSRQGGRLKASRIRRMLEGHAARVGLHDPTSSRLEDHFSPHACRHWFTTHLIRAGMPRDFVKELRGDVRREAIDLYNHIDREELRRSYLAHIPQLGI